jgi:hypothetical protein
MTSPSTRKYLDHLSEKMMILSTLNERDDEYLSTQKDIFHLGTFLEGRFRLDAKHENLRREFTKIVTQNVRLRYFEYYSANLNAE